MSNDAPLFTYVEPAVIAQRVQSLNSASEDDLSAKKNFVIIDVRDEEEFSSGHVAGAHHAPCEWWHDTEFVTSLARRYEDKEEVVVHCFKSQQRGPACARLLARALEQHSERNGVSVPVVRVLRGGFSAFESEFRDDSAVIATGAAVIDE